MAKGGGERRSQRQVEELLLLLKTAYLAGVPEDGLVDPFAPPGLGEVDSQGASSHHTSSALSAAFPR